VDRESLIDQCDQRRDLNRPIRRRTRGQQQQFACEAVVLPRVVDQQLDEFLAGQRPETHTRIIERQRRLSVLPQPAQTDRDAVLAERSLASNRARAPIPQAPAISAQLNRVRVRAIDSRGDLPGADPQRSNLAVVEVPHAALIRARPSKPPQPRSIENIPQLLGHTRGQYEEIRTQHPRSRLPLRGGARHARRE